MGTPSSWLTSPQDCTFKDENHDGNAIVDSYFSFSFSGASGAAIKKRSFVCKMYLLRVQVLEDRMKDYLINCKKMPPMGTTGFGLFFLLPIGLFRYHVPFDP